MVTGVRLGVKVFLYGQNATPKPATLAPQKAGRYEDHIDSGNKGHNVVA